MHVCHAVTSTANTKRSRSVAQRNTWTRPHSDTFSDATFHMLSTACFSKDNSPAGCLEVSSFPHFLSTWYVPEPPSGT